jgi:hypothetical protein
MRAIRDAFSVADPNGKGELSRHEFKECLTNRPERVSPQEVQMLMQMMMENDSGMVPYEEVIFLMQQLRIDALHNAMVETDVCSLRVHLIILLRREGLTDDLLMPIWTLRKILLSADQLCLSRMQVHVILCIVHPNEHGMVDVEYFLRVACTVIPYMFDAASFMEKAALTAKEKADAQAKAELEELQGLAGGTMTKKNLETSDEDQGDSNSNLPDRDTVEKNLNQLGNLFDNKTRTQPTVEVHQFLAMMRHEMVAQCQLSDAEIRGFIAEAVVDEDSEIAYQDHVKTWVPIVFELRKSRVHDGVLSKDWASTATYLVDLSPYEAAFPILPDGMKKGSSGPPSRRNSRNMAAAASGGRRESRRGSESGARRMSDVVRNSKNVERASLKFMAGRKGSKASVPPS